MSSDWTDATLGDVVRFDSGRRNSQDAVNEGKHPFFTCSRDILRHSEYDFDCEAVIMAGNNAEARFHLQYFNGKFAARQRTYVMSPSSGDLSCRFLFYCLQQLRFHFKAHAQGTTTKFITIGILRDAPISLPARSEQNVIAHILGTLDDKIELNRKTNETLEAMAKALFKSWFVDFDPVRAKAEGRPTGLPADISDLFPDSFEDSELGEIPSGWTFSRLGEISEWRSGSTPSKAKLGYWGGSTPWISATSMRDAVVFSSDASLSDLALESGARLAPKGSVLLLVRGSGLHTRIAVCLAGVEVAFNQDVKAITARPGSHFSSDLILAYLNSQVEQLLGMVEFTGIGAGKLDTGRLQDLPVAYPGQHLLEYADCLISSIYRKIGVNLLGCQALSEMRDTLLPKLISGELRIPDAEKLLEEAGV